MFYGANIRKKLLGDALFPTFLFFCSPFSQIFSVNAKDASLFEMDPTIAYRINPDKACDIFSKYRVGVKELEEGYIRTCIYEAYYNRTIAASLSPMIVQEDMIEKWDGKMPQIMTGNGGMMMDISKVIGAKK